MWDIAKFEISYLLRRPATYVYFFVFFLLTFLFMTTDVVQIGGGIAKVKINSPFVIFQSTLIMTIVGVVITTALAGTAVIRDFQFKTHELFYTKPITKASYLGGG
jgi:ABC-type transport system involved in multi-copper enzyme maturation permease subunit